MDDSGWLPSPERLRTSPVGSMETLSTRVAAHVDSVSIEASGLVLNLAGVGPQPLSAVRRIG